MPFVPTDIAGLKHWLAADTGVYQDALLATPCTNGTAVYTWKNNGSTAANFIQATAARQPYWYDTGGMNGKPYLTFTDDWLQATTAAHASPITVFIVFKCTGVTNANGQLFGDTGSGWQIYCSSATGGSLYTGGATLTYSLTGSAQLLYGIIRTAAPYNYLWGNRFPNPYINGASSGSTTLPANPVIGAMSGLGTSYVFKGDYYEFLMYDTALSESNRALVADYLMLKYALDLGTANTSLYRDRPAIPNGGVVIDTSFSELFQYGIRQETTEGEAATPCLAIDRPGRWRFRWGVKTGTRTISVKTKQISNVTGQRPRLIVKAEPLLGVASDVIVDAADDAGWVTLGPASITPTSNGVVWVELWNMDNTSIELTPAYFDDITTT